MNKDAVSLATLKQTIHKLKENAKTTEQIANLWNKNARKGFTEVPQIVLEEMEADWITVKDLDEVVVCVEKLQKQQEQKMNVIIRIKSLKAREHFARRLGFENLGHLIGGHALSTEWKETDWLPENLPPFLGKRKVKEVLGEGNKS